MDRTLNRKSLLAPTVDSAPISLLIMKALRMEPGLPWGRLGPFAGRRVLVRHYGWGCPWRPASPRPSRHRLGHERASW
jgi:hypothetical protein